MQVEAESLALPIMPFAYSFPSSDLILADQFSQEGFGEKLEEGLDQCGQQGDLNLDEGADSIHIPPGTMVVHTKEGPSLMNASLWPCLKTPLKGDRFGVVEQDELMDKSSTEFDFQSYKIKVNSSKGDMVDLGDMEEVVDAILENTDNTEGVGGACKLPDLEGLQEDWILAKKKGEKKV